MPSRTLIPALAVKVKPSARISRTSPVTVIRFAIVTSLFTTYQPGFSVVPLHAVSLDVTGVAVAVPGVVVPAMASASLA